MQTKILADSIYYLSKVVCRCDDLGWNALEVLQRNILCLTRCNVRRSEKVEWNVTATYSEHIYHFIYLGAAGGMPEISCWGTQTYIRLLLPNPFPLHVTPSSGRSYPVCSSDIIKEWCNFGQKRGCRGEEWLIKISWLSWAESHVLKETALHLFPPPEKERQRNWRCFQAGAYCGIDAWHVCKPFCTTHTT